MDMVWMGVTVVAAVSAALLGAGVSWSIVSRRARMRERRFVVAAQDQLATSTRSLRATNTRLQVELETERAALQRRVTAGLAEQRATTQRLQEQLRFAYMEIDHLKALAGQVQESPEVAPDGSGFALTQPFMR